jgi:hypothetical protein
MRGACPRAPIEIEKAVADVDEDHSVVRRDVGIEREGLRRDEVKRDGVPGTARWKCHA